MTWNGQIKTKLNKWDKMEKQNCRINKIGKMDKNNEIHTILIKSTKLVKLENEQNWTNDLKMA